MSSQESVRESRVSNPAPEPTVNSDTDHFGPATEEDMEADLMRVDAMEDQEVTSRLRKYEEECLLFSRSYVTPLGARSFSRYRKASQGNNGPQAASQ